MSRFSYVLDRLKKTPFTQEPFTHIYIEDLLRKEDFDEIVNSPQIMLPTAASDEDLISKLHEQSYQEIKFPGTTTEIPAYIRWHNDRKGEKNLNIDICEGFGVTMRLQKPETGTVIAELHDFFKSDELWRTMADRFGLDLSKLTRDSGLQKYLDGYEISPHPDIRRKALTFMLNLNPAVDSENLVYHTHYMRFSSDREYVREFWAKNSAWDRCWVPWNWCETVKQQTLNNSMVIFSPADDTMHAVRAAYDHLPTQRTQFYGNLWHPDMRAKHSGFWTQLKDREKLKELATA